MRNPFCGDTARWLRGGGHPSASLDCRHTRGCQRSRWHLHLASSGSSRLKRGTWARTTSARKRQRSTKQIRAAGRRRSRLPAPDPQPNRSPSPRRRPGPRPPPPPPPLGRRTPQSLEAPPAGSGWGGGPGAAGAPRSGAEGGPAGRGAARRGPGRAPPHPAAAQKEGRKGGMEGRKGREGCPPRRSRPQGAPPPPPPRLTIP